MKIFLHNWSGHGNLGDDEMARIFTKLFGSDGAEFVQGEEEWDWKIVGGGTLIAPNSEFMRDLEHNGLHADDKQAKLKHTILFGVGVSANWNGEFVEELRECAAIYVRDLFSHTQLTRFQVPCVLSVDPWFALEPRVWYPSKKIMANVMVAPESPVEGHEAYARHALERLKGVNEGVQFFAMSDREDVKTMPEGTFCYNDGSALINDLSTAGVVFVTRLHAAVAAWIAGVRDIRVISYDPKVRHFLEYVNYYDVKDCQNILLSHVADARKVMGL